MTIQMDVETSSLLCDILQDHATPQDLEDLKVAKADQQRLEDFCSSVSSFIG